MKNSVKKTLIIGLFLICTIMLIQYFSIGEYLTLEQLKNNKNYLKELVGNNYWYSVVVYLGIYISVIALCIPATPPLTIVGGFLFGLIPGLSYAFIGATIGSTISFLIVRYVLKNTVSAYFQVQIEQFQKQMSIYGMAIYLLILQLATIFPFFMINTLAALAHVPLWVLIWTSAVGSFPSLFAYTLAGRQLCRIESVGDVFSPSIIIVFLLLILVALLPLFFRKFR
ncbi:MAG: VTT domain-containing protein [Candidatus Babeliales bacterium]